MSADPYWFVEPPPPWPIRLGAWLASKLGLVTSDDITALRQSLVEEVVTTAAQQYDDVIAALAVRIGVLTAEITSAADTVALKDAALSAASAALADLQGQLDGERATRAAEVARLVDAAMEADAQRDLARVKELLTAAGGTLPVEVPDVPVPPAGDPAEVPTDSGVDPVDEEALPDTTIPTGETVTDSAPSGDVPLPSESGASGDGASS